MCVFLQMQACSVVLRVVKSRGPLLQAGKLLYRLSKDSNNDPIFRCELFSRVNRISDALQAHVLVSMYVWVSLKYAHSVHQITLIAHNLIHNKRRRERLLEPIVRIIQIMITTAAASSSAPTPSAGELFVIHLILALHCMNQKMVTNAVDFIVCTAVNPSTRLPQHIASAHSSCAHRSQQPV